MSKKNILTVHSRCQTASSYGGRFNDVKSSDIQVSPENSVRDIEDNEVKTFPSVRTKVKLSNQPKERRQEVRNATKGQSTHAPQPA